jgi:hypothetical protein
MTTVKRSAGPPITLRLFLLLFIALSSRLNAETVSVPIKLDYPVLQQLMLNRLFNAADHSTEILHDPSGCNEIFLSNPRLGEQRQRLEIVTGVKASLGTALLGRCTNLLYWTGEARFLTEPVIVAGSRAVKLNVLDSQLYNRQGELMSSGRLWELVKGRFQPFLGQFSVDLAPSIGELSLLLPDVLSRHSAQQLQAVVDSLTLAGIRAEASGLDVDVSFEVERIPEHWQPEAPLSQQELQQWDNNWQMMDAVITFAVKHYASTTKRQELRAMLLDILLDARYRLQEALTTPVSQAHDPVRHWFVSSWEQLSPVIRQIGLETPGQESMLWISLLAATDTLHALDRLGPAIGLDISADGLRRLARMLNHQPSIDPLRYEEAVDPELRRLMQLPSSPKPPEPTSLRFDLWPVRSAHADTAVDRLNHWVPTRSELDDYLPLVRRLLEKTAATTVRNAGLDPPVVTLYQQLVMATGWQESCWRQYVVQQKKIVPLRSNTGDVGLMQLNEKVWRGFYDLQKLRWDIAYNTHAGAEVLLNYLVRYALKKGEHKQRGGLDNLARATYSAYNGGPSKVSRYRDPATASAHKKIDSAFWEKYRKVKQGKELHVARCLGGDKTDVAASMPAIETKKSVDRKSKNTPAVQASKAKAGRSWVLEQNKNHFTLQLAVFSTSKAAENFIDQESLSGIVANHPVHKDKRVLYAVLYGSYRNRSDADNAKRTLGHLKPWIRQFKELRR